MAKQTFTAPKISEFQTDLSNRKIFFPFSLFPLTMPDGEWAQDKFIQQELRDFVKHHQMLENLLEKSPVFMLNTDDLKTTNKDIFDEVVGTVKVMAEHDLVRLPYGSIWVETPSHLNISIGLPDQNGDMTNQPNHLSHIGCYMRDMSVPQNHNDALGQMIKRKIQEGDGEEELFRDSTIRDSILYWPFIRVKDKEQSGKFQWVSLLHMGFISRRGLMDVDTENRSFKDGVISLCPSLLHFLSLHKGNNVWQEKLEQGWDQSEIAKLCMFIGLRLTTFLMVSLKTSWVEKEQVIPPPKLNKKRKKQNKPPMRSYIYVSSFKESMKKRAAQSNNTGRKMIPHLRRGHIHRFWTGSKESDQRKLVPKFVEPTWINTADNKKTPALKAYQIK